MHHKTKYLGKEDKIIEGLAGIDLGNLLIKGVVEELQKDLPRVKVPLFQLLIVEIRDPSKLRKDLVNYPEFLKLKSCDIIYDIYGRFTLLSHLFLVSVHGYYGHSEEIPNSER